MPTKTSPRSNADRSAATRLKLLEGTVDCLHQFGYAATTTIAVCKITGVARGGMLHHFPAKVDLIVAAGEHALNCMREQRVGHVAGVDGPPPRPEAIMEVEVGRYGVAITEIMVGSRSDAELAARFAPLAEIILNAQRAAAANMARVWGVEDVAALEAMVWLHMAAMRGMALMKMAGVDSGATPQALALISAHRQSIVERLRAKDAEAG